MFDKNKNIIQNYVESVAANLGLVAMSLAATVSLLELHEARMPRFVDSMQPVFAHSSEHVQAEHRVEQMMRREKEENRHALVSYGTTMRSHPTAGTV